MHGIGDFGRKRRLRRKGGEDFGALSLVASEECNHGRIADRPLPLEDVGRLGPFKDEVAVFPVMGKLSAKAGKRLLRLWSMGQRRPVEDLAREIGYSGLDFAPLFDELLP